MPRPRKRDGSRGIGDEPGRNAPGRVQTQDLQATPPAASAVAQPGRASRGERPLKETFKNAFLIAIALDYPRRHEGQALIEITLATIHFNAITPENSMKPMALQPREGRFHFAEADRLVEFAEHNNAIPIGHCLVWHSQTPPWFFEGPDMQPAGRKLAHRPPAQTYCDGRWALSGPHPTRGRRQRSDQRCAGAMAAAVPLAQKHLRRRHRPGVSRRPRGRPQAVLIYNDYGLEQRDKRRKALRLLGMLLEQNAPVHAVGIQGHWRMDHPDLAEVEEAIQQFAGLGLKVMITELDIGVLPTNYLGADIAQIESMTRGQRAALNPYPKSLPEAVAQQHAERYRQAFALFLRHQDKIDRVTFWGVHDGRSWLNHFPIRGRTDYPLLFDRQGKPEPAFYAVENAAGEAAIPPSQP